MDQNHYLRTSPSTSPISTNGSTLRSARLQTARAICKDAEVFPPPGKIKFSKGGKCFVYSSIHSSSSAVCLMFKEGTLSICDLRADEVGVARQDPTSRIWVQVKNETE